MDQKEEHQSRQERQKFMFTLWMCEEARGISFTFRCKNAEAIDAAGGFSEKANQTAWNLAEVLQDGMQVYIPSKDEAKEAAQ